jgi:hypothetical protein
MNRKPCGKLHPVRGGLESGVCCGFYGTDDRSPEGEVIGMGKLVLVLVVLLLVGAGGMAVFLAYWEPPMQSGTLEIPISNDRLSLQ